MSPYSELFWSVFSRIWTEYGEMLRIFPYSVQIRENKDQSNSEYEHFSRSVWLLWPKVVSSEKGQSRTGLGIFLIFSGLSKFYRKLKTKKIQTSFEVYQQAVKQLIIKVYYIRDHVPLYLWEIEPILKFCIILKYYFRDCPTQILPCGFCAIFLNSFFTKPSKCNLSSMKVKKNIKNISLFYWRYTVLIGGLQTLRPATSGSFISGSIW